MSDDTRMAGPGNLPSWLPDGARHYLIHTEAGLSIRALARDAGLHASTILRQVRRYEQRRDDPLVDEGLRRLGRAHFRPAARRNEDRIDMAHALEGPHSTPGTAIALGAGVAQDTLNREGLRILRRLCEAGAVLAVARDMEKAVVVRDHPDGASTRTATVDRDVAEAMALRDWIAGGEGEARIARYRITQAGRAALKELLASAENRARTLVDGFGEEQGAFIGAVEARSSSDLRAAQERARRVRHNLSESPLAGLARRKDRTGEVFLTDVLVAAGERLREDFERRRSDPGSRSIGRRSSPERARCPRMPMHAGSPSPCGRSVPVWGTWRCDAAACSKGSRRQSGGWVGRRGRARSCCGSRSSICAGITLRKPRVRGR